jgi:hypothetical protein
MKRDFDPQCIRCQRFFGIQADLKKPTCLAFPSGIPDIIWQNEVIHDKPFKNLEGGFNDYGIFFKSRY